MGGGYAQTESGLSDIGLDWMMKQLAEVGVGFAAPLTHTPQVGGFGDAIHEPWKQPPFALLKTSPRAVLPGDSIHDSAIARWQKNAAYRPVAMTAWAGKNMA